MKKIALLDAGAQAEKVIMRRVLEQGHEVYKFPVDVSLEEIEDCDAIIISGGPRSVYEDGAMLPDVGIYDLGKPILGICYGMQAITYQLGGNVKKGERGQYGRSFIRVSKNEGLLSGLEKEERVLMSHFDSVDKVPAGFEVYAESEGMIAAIGDEERKIYATQFHPELVPVTKHGEEMFDNFFRGVCGFENVEGMGKTIEQEIEHAKRLIGDVVGRDKHVMHYLSGGVDSMVMAVLLAQCIEPERLHMRTLDTGTMRKGEIDEVRKMVSDLGLPNFEVLNVGDVFRSSIVNIGTREAKRMAGPLCGEVDPQVKRKIFGTVYAEIALGEMRKIAEDRGISLGDIVLGQGTLRPDMIESGDERVSDGEAHTIKTHHNAVDALKAIEKVEPLIELFKDQVREIALELGLGEEFAYRQPFPGPGLYCRIIGSKCEVEEGFDEIDRKVVSVAKERGFDARVLPVKTVGVQGDERSYKYPVVVFAQGDKFDWKEFAKFVLDLPNEVREVNRVLYSLEGVEEDILLTSTLMTSDVIRQTQEADFVMREIAGKYGFNDSRKCSQMPGVLVPLSFGESGECSFVVRPIWTYDFMAIIGMMPGEGEECFFEEMFFEMAREIPRRVEGISRVLLDASDKPPASTEWE